MSAEHPAVTNFRNYIRIKTVHPNPDYVSCTKFLQEQAKELGAECQVIECVNGKPIVLMTILGRDLSLPSLLLNSHTDVVPVYPEHWIYDPFSAHKDEKGNIYGRGTQDMKSVGIQYLEALKNLKKKGTSQFLRTVYVSFVPDEEISEDGLAKFVQTDLFKKMNVGLSLDEGYANPSEKFTLFYGERTCWWVLVRCPGQPGHASQFLPDNSGVKLQKVINSFMIFREKQEKRLKENGNLRLGDVTTVNLTMLKTMSQNATCVEDGKNMWWDAFSATCKNEGITLEKEIFPACTDSRFIRALNIDAFGFSPMNKTPILLHDHNEYLNEEVFLRGIEIYTSIIPALANTV